MSIKNENFTRGSKTLTKRRKSRSTVKELELIDTEKKSWRNKSKSRNRNISQLAESTLKQELLRKSQKREQNPDHISKLYPFPYFYIYCHSLQHQQSKIKATAHSQSMVWKERETDLGVMSAGQNHLNISNRKSNAWHFCRYSVLDVSN